MRARISGTYRTGKDRPCPYGLRHAKGGAVIALQAVVPTELCALVPELTLAEARRVVSAVHRGRDLGGHVRQVRRTSLEAVRARGGVPGLELRSTTASRLDPFVKLALGTHDGHVIETVRIPLERPGRYSVCVSS